MPPSCHRQGAIALALALAFAATALSAPIAAQEQMACFAGRDLYGQPAKAWVVVERYGDWFEVNGQIHGSGAGQIYRFKADGHSGAGRLFQQHEYEAGVVDLQVMELTERVFVFHLSSYGTFHFQRTPC